MNIYWHPWFGPVYSTFGCLEVSFADNSYHSLTRCFKGTSSFSWMPFRNDLFCCDLGGGLRGIWQHWSRHGWACWGSQRKQLQSRTSCSLTTFSVLPVNLACLYNQNWHIFLNISESKVEAMYILLTRIWHLVGDLHRFGAFCLYKADQELERVLLKNCSFP